MIKKLFKALLKSFLKIFGLFAIVLFTFIIANKGTTYADYSVDYDVDLIGSLYKRTGFIDVSNAISITVNSYNGTTVLNNFTYAINGVNSYSNRFSMNTPIDTTNIDTIDLRLARVVSGSVSSNDVTSANYTITFPGDKPPDGSSMTENRSLTEYIYNFSGGGTAQDNPYFHFYFEGDLADIKDKVYAVKVIGSTVGGDNLEWRLSNVSNGVINRSSGWLNNDYIGQYPVSTVDTDYWSIGLRFVQSDGTVYPLTAAEINYVSVTLYYREDVYLNLPPGEYVETPTENFEVEVPTVDFEEMNPAEIDGFSDYVSILGRIVGEIFTVSGLDIVIPFLLIFTFIFFLLMG